jgi:hypothetical protein
MFTILIVLILLALAVLLVGAVYRRLRARVIPDLSDQDFILGFPLDLTEEAKERVLRERRRIGRVLGVPPRKLSATQSVEFLARRFGYLAEFSVAWNDLLAEAAETRAAAGLSKRELPPMTVGEMIEDLLNALPTENTRSRRR